MPKGTLECSEALFNREEKAVFKAAAKASIARRMDAYNPQTGEMTTFAADPSQVIDLVIYALPPSDYDATAACLLTIVTYGLDRGRSDYLSNPARRFWWEDRMNNMEDRLQGIADDLAPFVPRQELFPSQWVDAINVTFLGKGPGCWAAAPAVAT